MAKRYQNKVVWITGGGSGIGRAMALEFASQGASLALSGRRAERLEAVAVELKTMGAEALCVPVDVTDEDGVHAAAKAVYAHYGKLDVTVANAGFGVTGRIEDLKADDWRRQFEVNVIGLTTTIAASLPFLRETQGRIALIGSVMSQVTFPKSGPYAASKYAVRAIGQTLSMELHGSGVSCTTIYPGFVESEIGQVDNTGIYRPDRKDARPSKFMWKADRAAKVCVDAIAARKRDFTFTGHGKIGVFLGRHLPSLNHWVGRRQVGPRMRQKPE